MVAPNAGSPRSTSPWSDMMPPDMRRASRLPQVFHEVLVHRWLLAERAGHEVDIFDACQDYMDQSLSKKPGGVATVTTPPVS